jgi:type IV secretion system protein VirD4
MSLNAITQSDDITKKFRNILIVGAFVAAIIFKDSILNLLSSLLFRFALMAAAALACFLIYKFLTGRKIKESTAHGSATFATEKDLLEYQWLYELKKELQPIAEPGGFLLSRTSFKKKKRSVELSRDETAQHVLILGPTGTGKSRCFFLPNLRHTRRQSFIATDPKGELYELTSGYHHSLRFAPRDPDRSLCFNWIPLCQKAFITNLLARAIVVSKGESREPFWDDAEINFLASLMAHAATFDTPTPAAMYDFLTGFEQEDLIEQLLNSPSKIARQFIRLFQQASDNVRGNTALGLGSKLSWLMDSEVRRFTSASKTVWDFSQLREHAAGVYWILSETDVAILKPLTSLFFTLILYSIKQRDGLPVTLYLDELANCGKILGLDSEITVLRGRNVSIVAGLQSFSQLAMVYGQHAENIFRDNFLTKIFLHGLDAETNEKCSQSLGEFTFQEEVSSFSFSDNNKRSETKSISRNQRRLMTGDEIRRLDKNKFILIHSNRKPAILPKQYYSLPANPAEAPEALGAELTADFEQAAQRLRLQKEAEQMGGRKQIGGAPARKQLAAPKQKQIAIITYKALPPMPEMPAELIIDAEVIEDEEEG